MAKNEKKRGMTVQEAGHKGGQRVSELVQEGKEKERTEGGREGTRHEPQASKKNR